MKSGLIVFTITMTAGYNAREDITWPILTQADGVHVTHESLTPFPNSLKPVYGVTVKVTILTDSRLSAV